MPYIMTESGLVPDVEELRIQAKEKKMLHVGTYVSLGGLLLLGAILTGMGAF